MKFKAKTGNLLEAWENASDQGFVLIQHLITERSKAKSKQFRIAFDTQLKTGLNF